MSAATGGGGGGAAGGGGMGGGGAAGGGGMGGASWPAWAVIAAVADRAPSWAIRAAAGGGGANSEEGAASSAVAGRKSDGAAGSAGVATAAGAPLAPKYGKLLAPKYGKLLPPTVEVAANAARLSSLICCTDLVCEVMAENSESIEPATPCAYLWGKGGAVVSIEGIGVHRAGDSIRVPPAGPTVAAIRGNQW